MSFRGLAFLAGASLALLNIPACGARGGGGGTIITDDTGTSPTDTGVAPVDAGTLPTDTGLPPRDNGFPSTDNGFPPVDNGFPPTDVGTPRVDAGTPTCPSPTMLCGTRCINVDGDPANCGACARACAAGTTCTAGACVAIATGVAASGTCTGATCGPVDALQCSAGLAGGGFCTAFCTLGSAASEADQCGGAGSTCVSNPPFTDVPATQGLCMRACNPAATSETSGGCRAGQACTSFWYNLAAGGAQDSPGCFPHCTSDAQCAGAISGDAGLMRCNVRTGRCAAAAADLSLIADGDPCNPAQVTSSGRAACRGTCFRITTDGTQGICGSYLNLGVSTNCPDNPTLVRPLSRTNDNLAVCVFKTCLHNSECTAPLRCTYPESAGTVRMDLAPSCSYVSALQPSGIP